MDYYTFGCGYTYDGLARLSSVNCGSVWSQTFSYDPFGNITKSGSQSWNPGYSATTNQFAAPATYDSNGNLTYDGVSNYTWDAEGNMASFGSSAATYDALDRRVEQYNGSAYTEIVYGPAGNKFALMNGQTVTKVFTQLPGGATAVYNSSGLAYYRHPDWLGSSRLASTPTRTVYYDGAYAPFGENYAETGTTDRSFTGQNQDLTPGSGLLYDFPNRELHSTQGRWISPDPAGLGAVDPTNPQTWNRYAYVLNNPLALVDPSGLYNDCGGQICQPFSYDVGLGCSLNVTYSWVTGSDGVPIRCRAPIFLVRTPSRPSARTPAEGPPEARALMVNRRPSRACAHPNPLQRAAQDQRAAGTRAIL